MTNGAFCYIFDDQHRILLCKRTDKDMWNLPGGRVEQGEAPWEAVVREAREEIGVDIEVETLAGIYFKKEQDDMVCDFVARITSGTPAMSDEVEGVAYFSLDEIPENTAPFQVVRIRLYYDDPKIVRFQNL